MRFIAVQHRRLVAIGTALFLVIAALALWSLTASLLSPTHVVKAQTSGEVSSVSPLDVLTFADLNELGIYAVTSPQFGDCLGDGITDCTAAIQNAIDYAYQQPDYTSANKGIVYFPPGRYLISDTLRGYTDRYKARDRGILLVGSTASEKPQIILAANTFNDGSAGNNRTMDANKKAMLHIWVCSGLGESDPENNSQCQPHYASQSAIANQTDGQPAVQMSSGVRNLEFIIRDGNPEAIGIRFAGAQNNILSNVTITMEGDAFAGLYSLIGTNSVVENITITGGEIGIHAGASTWPTLNNVRLLNQRYLALSGLNGNGPITINGFEIVKASAPAISDEATNFKYLNKTYNGGTYALSDGLIRFTSMSSGPAIDNRKDRQVTLHNVTIENTPILVANMNDNVTTTSPARTRVAVYAKVVPPYGENLGARVDQMTTQTSDLVQLVFDPPAPNVNHLLALHGVDTAQLPSPDVILARSKAGDPAYVYVGHEGIDGIPANVVINNSSPNVSAALQQVIDRPGVKYILLGRGTYLLNDTLELNSQTHLFGVSPFLSQIRNHPAWTTTTTTDMIRTPNSAQATTTVGFFNVRYSTTPSDYSFNVFHWRAGGNSLIYQTTIRADNSAANLHSQFQMRAEYLFDGHGGGRAYGIGPGGRGARTKWNPNFRAVMVDHTDSPLTFYALDVEDAGYDCVQDPLCPNDDNTVMQMEIRNAANVAIRGFKCEDYNSVHAYDSTNLFASGIGGCTDWLFTDSTDFLLLNIVAKFNYSTSPAEGTKTLYTQRQGPDSISFQRRYALAAVSMGNSLNMTPWYQILGLGDPPVEPTTTPTAELAATETATPTETATATETATPTETGTSSPTAVPTSTATPLPTATATATATSVPTALPTAVPSSTASPTVTVTATASPTTVPTATATTVPTASPTTVPTASPTTVPTASPTTVPTATATKTASSNRNRHGEPHPHSAAHINTKFRVRHHGSTSRQRAAPRLAGSAFWMKTLLPTTW